MVLLNLPEKYGPLGIFGRVIRVDSAIVYMKQVYGELQVEYNLIEAHGPGDTALARSRGCPV